MNNYELFDQSMLGKLKSPPIHITEFLYFNDTWLRMSHRPSMYVSSSIWLHRMCDCIPEIIHHVQLVYLSWVGVNTSLFEIGVVSHDSVPPIKSGLWSDIKYEKFPCYHELHSYRSPKMTYSVGVGDGYSLSISLIGLVVTPWCTPHNAFTLSYLAPPFITHWW